MFVGLILGLFGAFLLGHLRSCTPACLWGHEKHLRDFPNSPETLHE